MDNLLYQTACRTDEMKIAKKYESLVFGAIMGGAMSFVMSLLITLYYRVSSYFL